MKNRLLVVVILLLLFGGIYFSLRTPQETIESLQTGPTAKEENILPDKRFQEFELTFFSPDASLSWHITAEELVNFEDKNFLQFKPVLVTVVDSQEDFVYQLEASQGTYLDDKLKLLGSISLTKGDLRLSLQELDWDKENNYLVGRGDVRLESPFFLLSGSSLESSLDLQKITIYGDDGKQAFFIRKEGG